MPEHNKKNIPATHETISEAGEDVRRMFDEIAPHYDFLNHFLSMGIDRCWRKKVIKAARNHHPQTLLDVAAGTADLTIALATLPGISITGIDISEAMLAEGRKKVNQRQPDKNIILLQGDSENLPFADATFDMVTVAFGVRNFEHLEKGLAEMLRVLKKGGQLLVLEFSMPEKTLFKQLYHLYFKYFVPFIGAKISGHRFAYSYLPATVQKFPKNDTFVNILRQTGFTNAAFKPLTFGIVCLYSAEK
jgi:demethylmenaquinone methyltransferase/2-methoxy-6-polyprenyl-1,4-benzoquinol methylase